MLQFRRAVLEDATALAQLDEDTGVETYTGVIPASAMASRSTVEERIPRFQARLADPEMALFVADHETDRLVGYVRAGLNRDEPGEYTGKIFALYVRAAWQGQGVGRRLFTSAIEWLIANGHHSMCLQVYGELPARAFYTHMGGELIDLKTGEDGVPMSVYGWRNLAATDVLLSQACP